MHSRNRVIERSSFLCKPQKDKACVIPEVIVPTHGTSARLGVPRRPRNGAPHPILRTTLLGKGWRDDRPSAAVDVLNGLKTAITWPLDARVSVKSPWRSRRVGTVTFREAALDWRVLLNLKVPFDDLIAMTTWHPAKALKRPQLGHL